MSTDYSCESNPLPFQCTQLLSRKQHVLYSPFHPFILRRIRPDAWASTAAAGREVPRPSVDRTSRSGAVYGAMKRLAGEGLLREVGREREGNRPTRQLYEITDEGRHALAEIRRLGLSEVWFKFDPFDLALTRMDADVREELPSLLAERPGEGASHAGGKPTAATRRIARMSGWRSSGRCAIPSTDWKPKSRTSPICWRHPTISLPRDNNNAAPLSRGLCYLRGDLTALGVPMPSSKADEPPTLAPTLAPPPYTLGPDSLPQPGVPQGEMLSFPMTHSALYPGTERTIWVYVPAQVSPLKSPPACASAWTDRVFEPHHVFDNLIFQGKMPVTIGVFVSPGAVNKPGTRSACPLQPQFRVRQHERPLRALSDRRGASHRRDAQKPPTVRAIHLSADPNDAMIYGASSGGVCAFTAAWQRPDRFRRVFTSIGTYVGMRGADSYVTLVRKTEPKPLRIFLQDGRGRYLESALRQLVHAESVDGGVSALGELRRDPTFGEHWGTKAPTPPSLFPQAVTVALARLPPSPLAPAVSPNSMLQAILTPGAGLASRRLFRNAHLPRGRTGRRGLRLQCRVRDDFPLGQRGHPPSRGAHPPRSFATSPTSPR